MRKSFVTFLQKSLPLLIITGASHWLYAENIYATFNIEAKKNANLAFTATGIVDEVAVDVASPVKEGQLLAKLESSDLQSALNVAEANLNNTKVSLKFSKRAYERESQVKKLISESQHDQVIQRLEEAQTKIAQMEASVAYQKAMLNKTLLYAPFDGVIYHKEIEKGDAVSGAMLRTVFKIHDIKSVNLVLEIDQKYWKMLHVGQKFQYRVDGDPKQHEGEIAKIYPFADSNNRKIKAEVLASGFVPGLFGDGYILADDQNSTKR
jgi:RND family efflux transporter MFP subunit